jgi:hypothetical protein
MNASAEAPVSSKACYTYLSSFPSSAIDFLPSSKYYVNSVPFLANLLYFSIALSTIADVSIDVTSLFKNGSESTLKISCI